MKVYKAKDRAKLYHKLYIYKERREYYKNYGKSDRRGAWESVKLQRSIDLINRRMKEIDKRNNQIIALGNTIATFMGINVKDIGSPKGENQIYAKFIFCKWGMENGIAGVLLSEYMGVSDGIAPLIRKRATEALKTKEFRDIWNRWKIYFAEITGRMENQEGNKY